MQITKAEFAVSSARVDQCPKTDLPEFAFIGRSNVGKSSLINMLVNRKSLAKTSGSPGKTRLINHFLINDQWHLVDLPGYGYAKVSKSDRSSFMRMIYDYFENRMNMVNAFVLIDSRHEPQKNDLEFMKWMGEHGIPFAIIFTKIDKLSSTELRKNTDRYKREMLKEWETMPPIFISSAESKIGKEDILKYVNYCIEIYSS